MASRRRGDWAFDHGAVALRARTGAFAEYLARYGTDWPEGGGTTGEPGISSLAKPLAQGLPVTLNAEVTGLRRSADGWHLSGGGVPETVFDRIVLAVPQPQALALLAPWPAIAARIAPAMMRPCWAALVAFDRFASQPALRRPASGPLALIVREAAKPGRALPGEAFTLHATADWSRAHLDLAKPEAAALLLEAFFAATSQPAQPPALIEGHRWRFAVVDRPLGDPCLLDPGLQLGLCGDWCLGPEAEDAFTSGQAMAGALLG